MLGERDVAWVAPVHLAVVERRDVALGRPGLVRAERLAPFVEEVPQRVGAVDRRLDVHDAVGGVAVQPVKALPAADEFALRAVLAGGSGYPDAGRDLSGR